MSAIVIFLILSMMIVLYFDVTRYIIPNWLVGLMIVAYPVAIALEQANVDWKMAIAGALIVLVAGYIIFARRLMGGGDVKLMTACALWVGWDNLLDYIFAVTLFGGIFAVSVWCIRKAISYGPKKPQHLPRILRNGEPVPYGVAIAFGFLLMMYSAKVPVLL